MIIDERQLEGGLTVRTIAKLIDKHEQTIERYARLYNYYKGEHDVTKRRRASSGAANNKLVCNHARYITDMSTSYLVGNAVSYSPADEYDIDAVKNAYVEQDIASVDTEIVKGMSIYGHSYELIYTNEEGKARSAYIPPEKAFVIYNDDCTHMPLYGVYYYKIYDVDDNVKGVECVVWDSVKKYTYGAESDSWLHMELRDEQPHFFGNVPLIEYRNNNELQGDFEQVISLIDAYDILQSDRVNDKEQFVDAFLFLTGIDIDSETAKKLKEEKILMGYEGAKAEYLNKIMTESDIEVLRNNIKDDIHRFSMVPDLSDETFGNNLSGVAIKYKLLGFEQHIKDKERYFAKSLKKRFEIYNAFLSFKGEMALVPIHKVSIIFTRNLPVNNYENAQMINNLGGKVSTETLIGQLDFVKDPEAEAEKAKEESINVAAETFARKTKENQKLSEGGYY